MCWQILKHFSWNLPSNLNLLQFLKNQISKEEKNSDFCSLRSIHAAYVRQCTLFLAQGILSKWLYSVDNLKIPLHNKKGSKSKKEDFKNIYTCMHGTFFTPA